MSLSCPISHRVVDANEVRVISFFVLIFVLLFTITQETLFITVAAFDYALRFLRFEKFSPFYNIALFIVRMWGVSEKPTDEAPKRFALYLGFFMTLSVLLWILFGFMKIAVAVALVLVICAFLEVLFDFCIGCKLYDALQLAKVINHVRNFN